MRPILQVAASFFTVAVVYWAYAATIVPLVEPDRRESDASRGSELRPLEVAAPESKYAAVYDSLFPPDHWTRTSRPKTLEAPDGMGMLVFDEYYTHENGRVKLEPCVIIYFPTPWSRSSAPAPRDAIVIESPQGASAQLDGPILLAERKIGRLENIWLTGPVFIHSDMEEEGPGDDLQIRTQDVQLNDRGIWSNAAVTLRLGPHTGEGERLDVRFLPGKKGNGSKGFDIGGVQSVQLLRNVRLVLEAASGIEDASGGVAETRPMVSSPGELGKQIELTCSGPLFVNVQARTAEFEQDVEVFVHGSGPSDSLTGETLKVVFADLHVKEPAGVASQSTTAGPRPPEQFPAGRRNAFEPVLFEATGQPVTINSPLRDLHGRCRRLVYDLRRQHLTLEALSQEKLAERWGRPSDALAGQPTLRQHELCQVDYGPHHVRAPRLEYTLDQESPRDRLGTLHVAGPGWFTTASAQEQNTDRPGQELNATWREGLQVIRQGGMPVLSLFGRPEINLPGVGRVAANDVHVWLTEQPRPAMSNDTENAAGASRTELVPDRILARQSVEVDSPQITARVGQLEAWLVSDAGTANPNGSPGEWSAPAATRQARPWQQPASGQSAQDKSYYVEADTLRLRATLPGDADPGRTSAEVTHLTLTGSVLFEERTDPRQPAAPVRVESEWLDVAEANTAAMTIRAKGQPVVAEINGAKLRGGEIRFDQARGRFDVPTPGDLVLTISRDLDGRPVEEPLPVSVSWQGTLSFNGLEAVLTEGVQVRTPHEQLQTRQLVAALASPVRLDKLEWDRQATFDKLVCTGGVVLNRQTFDAGGLISQDHAEVPDLTMERGVGQLHASGPGWLRSVQLDRNGPLQRSSAAGRPHKVLGTVTPHQVSRPSAAPATALSTQPGRSAAAGLTYLRIDFQREMRGNLDRREITFDGQVHCVRGPVKDWGQALHVEQLPQLPEDTVVLDAATLRIQQWHPEGKPWYGMEAEGGVEVEGGLRRNGIFTARGARLSYDQSKDLMILDGGAALASLVLEQSLGGERQSCQAASVYFWPSRPEVLGNYVRSAAGEF